MKGGVGQTHVTFSVENRVPTMLDLKFVGGATPKSPKQQQQPSASSASHPGEERDPSASNASRPGEELDPSASSASRPGEASENPERSSKKKQKKR